MSTYTIGQVAERSGFPASTLRFYENHGLLEPIGRSEGGYRLYDDRSLARLGFIDRAKQLGCTLEEIADLARLWADDDCAPVQARLHELVTTKLADAHQRSAELAAFIAQLQTAAVHLGGDAVDGPCSTDCACVTNPSSASGPEPVEFTGHPSPTIACTLSPENVPDRLTDWQRILTHVAGREQIPGGLRLVLDEATPLAELAELVVAEQGCCAFFSFAITIDQRGAALEVHAPSDADDVVTAVFGPPR